jgi:hypothetical protein
MHQLLLELFGPVKNDRSSMPISFDRLSYCLLSMELEKMQQYGDGERKKSAENLNIKARSLSYHHPAKASTACAESIVLGM